MKKISVSLAILVVILMLGVFVSLPLVKVNDLTHPVEDLKLSDGEITIVTPENKTYMGPMSGYYPATWGFENTFEGDDPLGWGVDESAGPIQVLDDYGNRKKVVEIEDNSGSADSNIQLNIADQENGTVEVWLRNTDADEYCQLILAQDNGLTHAQRVTTRIYNWRVSTSGWTDLTPAEDNIWYHVRIDFECGNNGYQGLPGNHCNVYINEVKFGPYVFENNVSAIDSIMISTSTFSFGRKIYADALGYSWDPDYSVGDNLNEGLLLSYENTTTLDWKGYSLDGVSNRTVLGNTTVPVPDNGLHNIQLYANNSIGTRFQSDLRYFTIDTSPYIDIITPENKTYTTPDSGYFPATYGFEDTMDGQDPLEWFDVDTQKGSIISEIDGHKKVYEAVDNSGSTGSSIFNYFDVQSYGTVEFWCRFSSASEGHFYNLRKVVNPGGPHISIIIENAPSPQINNWYHIRLDFRGSFLSNYQGLTDQYTYFIYIDDEQFGPYGYQVNEDLDGFVAHTGAVSSGFSIWWDAVGYSWDPNYNIGDNLNEGLLLSYENTTALDWQGYSLDGVFNKTVFGNKTIPIPSDGLHSIQVFGNNSVGTMYASDVRYFTTNLIGPDVTIKTPISSVLYGATPPDFSLTISDPDLNETWYSLDSGTTNIPFTGLIGAIDQTEWDKLGNGTATITFYANDSVNNIGQAEITVRKDIIAPSITIIDPSSTEEFEFTPIYEISIIEPNLDEIWYTVDGGVHNYTITETLGTINLVAWNGAPSGPMTIRFYARDLAGNIGTSFVIVVKTSAQVTPPPGIPGYNIIAIVGVCSLITLILMKKKRGMIKL
ncbi:MAG: Loki-CTERM sorting domain-containing protein [Promethearchaeota archaeon]|jgi:hypothetical protein